MIINRRVRGVRGGKKEKIIFFSVVSAVSALKISGFYLDKEDFLSILKA